jgi:hypothetical protein
VVTRPRLVNLKIVLRDTSRHAGIDNMQFWEYQIAYGPANSILGFVMKSKFFPLRWGCLGILCIGALVVFGLYVAIGVRPSIGARGADLLRGIIGNEAVTRLETIAFQVHDTLQQRLYDLGLAHPVAPWQAATTQATPTSPTFASTSTSMPTLAAAARPPATAMPTPAPWQPAPAKPLGKLEGEGAWTPYIQISSGQTVAYRTFLQPDPKRPYTVIGVVAFDLTRTRLHYVLGTQEPSVPKGPTGTGTIPARDRLLGILLATFNGGFKATHGHYGAMQDGVVAVPPRDGFAVVAMYKDGRVRIGDWGGVITQTQDLVAWRQNARLIIRDGQVTPQVATDLISDWGGNFGGVVVTWRSALGLSADNRILYYFAGPSLIMPVLARAMVAAGVQQGLELDINPYWVHFTTIQSQGNTLVADPLFPAEMKESKDRYLRTSARDFFYVTAAP